MELAANRIRLVLLCVFVVGVYATLASAGKVQQPPTNRRILVFGGNGFLGASTVDRLLDSGDNVTIVSRGNWYWDSAERIKPRVQVIPCDRQGPMEKCQELNALVQSVDTFDAVIDFSAYGAAEVQAAATLLQDKVKLYVMISTDSIYEVCEKSHSDATKETDAVRPDEQDDRIRLAIHHRYGENKLLAEEELIGQRQAGAGGFPFVILRLPDVIGPRDTTFRWWVYQLWLKLTPHLPTRPTKLPAFLKNYKMSLVYVEDVAQAIGDVLSKGSEIQDQVINLAYPETFTMEIMLTTIQKELGLDFEIGVEEDQNQALYLYPSVRRGPIDVTKAQSLLKWETTSWEDVVRETVRFYENAMSDDTAYPLQRDEIVQIVGQQLYSENLTEFYEVLEKVYKITLYHFKATRDEL